MLNYIKTHWRGEYSLVRSFWLNYVLLAAMECILLWLLVTPIIYVVYTSNSLSLIEASLALATMLGVAIYILGFVCFIWASVGVWRSSYFYIKNTSRKLWAIAAQIVVVLFAVYQIYAILPLDKFLSKLNAVGEICEVIFESRVNNEKNRTGEFALHYNNDESLTVSGALMFGSAREISNAIKKHPTINTLILQDCKGETVYEAKKIAKLVTKYHLDTIAASDCDIVCGQVFLAGKKRMVAKGVQLSFYKHTLDGIGLAPDLIKTLQRFENNYFENDFIPFCVKQGIHQEFRQTYLDKIAGTSSYNEWFLTEPEMIDYKIAHEILSHEQANLKRTRVSGVRYSWGVPI